MKTHLKLLKKSQIALLSFLCLTACKITQQHSYPQTEIEASQAYNQASAVDSTKIKSLIKFKEQEIATYQPARKKEFDILHLDLDLSFDYQNQQVKGLAELTIKPYSQPQRILVLDAQDFEIGKVYFHQHEEKVSLAYQYDEQQVQIYLPRTLSPSDTFLITMDYLAFPERNNMAGSQAITDTKGLYFIDPLDTVPGKPTMIWTQGETNHNSKWFPTIDSPNEKFTQLLKLTVPDNLVTISNGELIKQEALGQGFRKDYWEMKLPHSAYLTALAIGDFGKVEDAWEDIPLGYFVEKGFEKGAKKVFEHTPEMIEFFSELTGVKFPWPKYDQVVVRDFVSGAMENTTVSIFMEELRLNEREAIDSEWDYIIAHELFHQWFGNYVTTESWSNLVLNEGFANYSEFLWNEYKYGEDQAKLMLVAETENYFLEAEEESKDLVRFNYEEQEDMFDSHTYSKGGAVLHMLREYLGKEIFNKSLKLYLEKHAFQTVEVHDLRMAFEAVSGEDLNWFFNQWFLGKGHPALLIEVDYSIPENVLVTLTQQQDLTENQLFKLPVEVSWYEGADRKSKVLMMDKVRQQFALENGSPVSQVFIDEGKNIITTRNQELSDEELIGQFRISHLGVARYEALDSLRTRGAVGALTEVIPLALNDHFWAIRELGLSILQSNTEMLESVPSLPGKVYSMAELDPRNSVRAGALEVLGALDTDEYLFAFKEMVRDSSYMVAGSALMALVDHGDAIDLAFIEEFESEDNFRIVIPVADYFLQSMESEKGEWFKKKAERLSSEGLYYFMGYFGEYFSIFPDEGKADAVKFLFNKMKDGLAPHVKIGAFQALLSFADDDKILREIGRIMSEEEDELVVTYYENFMGALSDEN